MLSWKERDGVIRVYSFIPVLELKLSNIINNIMENTTSTNQVIVIVYCKGVQVLITSYIPLASN